MNTQGSCNMVTHYHKALQISTIQDWVHIKFLLNFIFFSFFLHLFKSQTFGKNITRVFEKKFKIKKSQLPPGLMYT